MIVSHIHNRPPNEEASPLPVPSGSPTHPEFEQHSGGVDATFSVGWRFTLRCTTDVFKTSNPVLREVVDSEPGTGPARVLVVIDKGVVESSAQFTERIRRYAETHDDRLALAGEPLVIVGGERAKNDRAAFEQVTRATHDARLCRRSYVLVVGGGAVLDVAGFAAAVAHRGVRLIRIPTTVLAQNDSGVGVKNGINDFGKKNFLGAFAPPHAVINDSSFLTTLTDRDWISGMSECVKVALVKDASFFKEIVAATTRLNARDIDTAARIIRRSAELHLAHVVTGGDPFERTAARPLDFGHWSAHKLEQMTEFEIRHGEAVSVGIALDTIYSMLAGWLAAEDGQRVLDGLRALRLGRFHEALQRTDDLLRGLEEFREHLGGQLTISMLRGIGDAFDVHSIDPDLVAKAIELLKAESGD